MPVPPPRLVLDTNVALDLFVFRDPGCNPLLAALQAGRAEAVVDEVCRAEWLAVLTYPALALEEATRREAGEAFDRWTHLLPATQLALREDVKLPRCGDPDDQKFLELALASGAQWLLSKDKELLKLARRTARAGWFQILPPSAWQLPVS